MAETKIPGICAKHAVVTPACRANKGEPTAVSDSSACDEALQRLRDAYRNIADADANKAANFHFVLTVEHSR